MPLYSGKIAKLLLTVMESKKDKETVVGVVEEALPNTLFRVTLEEGEEVLAFLSGKMRMHRIRVLVGDKVLIETDPYGAKGRITKRL